VAGRRGAGAQRPEDLTRYFFASSRVFAFT
jgi:hypothetical protein